MKEEIIFLTREQFFKLNPPESRGVTIQTSGKPDVFIPIGDEIICDLCNDLISSDTIGISGSYALCEKCLKELTQHLLKK